MVTDLHAHYLPPALADALQTRANAPAIVGESLKMPIGTVPFHEGYTDLKVRLAAMDSAGVDRQLLSLPGLFGIDSLPPEQAAPLCDLFNEGAAAASAAHPDRFTWLAAVPLARPEMAKTTLRKAMADGAKGVILSCGAFSSAEVAQTRAAPLLSTLAEKGGGHVFVHPGRWPDDPPVSADPYPDLAFARRQVHIQTEITEATITLLYAPTLDPYPTVTVQIANLGGVLAMVSERIEEVAKGRSLDAPDMNLRDGRIWLDCASMGPRAIEVAAGVFGPRAVVFGTDMPIFGAPERIAAVTASNLSGEARANLLAAGAALWT